jgi:hypothetical protein
VGEVEWVARSEGSEGRRERWSGWQGVKEVKEGGRGGSVWVGLHLHSYTQVQGAPRRC